MFLSNICWRSTDHGIIPLIDLVGLGSTGEVGLELVHVALDLGGSWSGEVGRTWTCVSGSGDEGLGGQWGGHSGVVGHLGL